MLLLLLLPPLLLRLLLRQAPCVSISANCASWCSVLRTDHLGVNLGCSMRIIKRVYRAKLFSSGIRSTVHECTLGPTPKGVWVDTRHGRSLLVLRSQPNRYHTHIGRLHPYTPCQKIGKPIENNGINETKSGFEDVSGVVRSR